MSLSNLEACTGLGAPETVAYSPAVVVQITEPVTMTIAIVGALKSNTNYTVFTITSVSGSVDSAALSGDSKQINVTDNKSDPNAPETTTYYQVDLGIDTTDKPKWDLTFAEPDSGGTWVFTKSKASDAW